MVGLPAPLGTGPEDGPVKRLAYFSIRTQPYAAVGHREGGHGPFLIDGIYRLDRRKPPQRFDSWIIVASGRNKHWRLSNDFARTLRKRALEHLEASFPRKESQE